MEKQEVLNIVSVCLYSCLGYVASKVILSPVSCLAVPYSSHYLIYGMIFGEKFVKTFLNLRGIERDITINLYGTSRKVLILISNCNET